MAKNCWEAKKCGRQPGGPRISELGVCPAASELRANGINKGLNGGRACWAIAGTLCKGQKQGTYAMKVKECNACEFYQEVQREEGKSAASPMQILKALS